MPVNRDFLHIYAKNPQVQQAARYRRHVGGVFGDAGVALIAVCNAMRIMQMKK
jgi:hypothetical protein